MTEDDLQRIQAEELARARPGARADLPLAARAEVRADE